MISDDLFFSVKQCTLWIQFDSVSIKNKSISLDKYSKNRQATPKGV